MVLRLAAEFQGFARDLHDLAAGVFAEWAVPTNGGAQNIVRSRFTEGRELDRGNANPGSLGKDFGRFGFDLWPALMARDRRSARHNASLERLNTARNALAHADEAKLAALRADGYPITLRTYRRWVRDVNQLASNLDAEMAARLAALFSRSNPW
jgi:hypothetical protein